MARNWTRALTAVAVVPLTSFAVLVAGTSPAAAGGSAQGIAANAWLVSDLAATAINTADTMPYDPVLEAELQTAAAATTGTTAKAGVKTKPKAGGKLGLILNTVGMLGALGMVFGGEDDEPTLPAPTGDNFGTATGNATCGYVRSTDLAFSSCAFANAEHRVNMTLTTTGSAWVSSVGGASVGRYLFRAQTGPQPDGLAGTGSTKTVSNTSDTNVTFDIHRWQNNVVGVKVGTVQVRGKLAPTSTRAPRGPTSDPALVPRYIDSEITCKSAGGGSQVVTNRVGPFYVTPGQPNELPEAPDLTCPEGTWLQSGTRKLASEGVTEKLPLTEYESPPWVEQQVTAHPECYPAGVTKCKLELVKVSTSPDLYCNSVPVGSGGHACRDWMTDPNKTTRYECRFGASVIALRRCEPYANSFKLAPTQVIAPSPANPDTAPTPPTPPDTDPTPGETPNLAGCTPEWADLLSPWWVFKATSCALSWAFIPPTGYMDAKATELHAQWSTTTPGLWVDRLQGMVEVPNGNCGGIPVDVDLAGGVDVNMNLGEACSGTMATTAGLVKAAVTAFICVGGAFAGVRILGAGLGWAPAIGKGAET